MQKQKIKLITIKLIYEIFRIVFYFIPLLKLINILRRIRSTIFSAIISKEFKSCGTNLSIFPPFYIVGNKNISIGSNFFSFSGLRLEAYNQHLDNKYNPILIIGNNVSINFDCHIACINKVIIGDNVLMASKIFITDHFHGELNQTITKIPPSKRKLFTKGSVIIEESVWIGEGATILPNVTIGKFSIVGANSVVTKSFPSFSVIAGNPAIQIKILQ